jgi:hypothetical protein
MHLHNNKYYIIPIKMHISAEYRLERLLVLFVLLDLLLVQTNYHHTHYRQGYQHEETYHEHFVCRRDQDLENPRLSEGA